MALTRKEWTREAMTKLKNMTPQEAAANPWLAIKLICYNNPVQLARALTELSGQQVPRDPEQLFAWIQRWNATHGNLDILAMATSKLPML